MKLLRRWMALLAAGALAGCAAGDLGHAADRREETLPQLMWPYLSFENPYSVAAFAAAVEHNLPTALPASPAEPTRGYGERAGGLAMRIDAAVVKYETAYVLVRVRNLGREPLRLPDGWRTGLAVSVKNRQGGWSAIPEPESKVHESPPEPEFDPDFQEDPEKYSPVDVQLPAEELQPGETAGAIVSVSMHGIDLTTQVKLRLRAGGEGDPGRRWSGELFSPASGVAEKWPEAIVPCPTYPQPLDMDRNHFQYSDSDAYEGRPEDLDKMAELNSLLIPAMKCYDPRSRRAALDRWLELETISTRRAYLGALAAACGSREGTRELLTQFGTTEIDVATDVRKAMSVAVDALTEKQSDAVVRLAIASLQDGRILKPVPPDFDSTAVRFNWDLIKSLGETKCREAVPALIHLMETSNELGDTCAEALGEIGDERAIRPLMRYMLTDRPPGLNRAARWALAKLRAPELLPVLMAHFDQEDIFDSVCWMPADYVRPSLAALAAAGGRVGKAEADSAATIEWRLFYSRVALLVLDRKGGVDELCRMARDTSMEEGRRQCIVYEIFRNHPDPRYLPVLLELIRTEKSDQLVESCIRTLEAYQDDSIVPEILTLWKTTLRDRGTTLDTRTTSMDMTIDSLLWRQTQWQRNKEQWLAWWDQQQAAATPRRE